MKSSFKAMLKEKISTYPSLNVERIKEQIEGYTYVSFDLYDTLIRRTVEKPSDIFGLTAKEYEEKTGKAIPDYCKIRTLAEEKARNLHRKKQKEVYVEETTLQEIYDMITEIPSKEKNILMQIESDLELQLCYENNEIKKLYMWCLDRNKKVIIISDMYLPEGLLKKILQSCGYVSWHKLYVSSTTALKKSTGNLYSYVEKDLNLAKNQWIHLGDSYKSDYLKAKRFGIEAVLLPGKINYLSRPIKTKAFMEDNWEYQMFQAMINSTMPVNKNIYYKFGYEAFGLLLYQFNRWLKEDLIRRKITKIFFFSRDGQVIKTAFDTMYGDCGIKEDYIYVSRRSLRVPQLWFQPDMKTVVYGFPAAKFLTVETFLKNIGLKPEQYTEELKKCSLTLLTVLKRSELLTNDKLTALYEKVKLDMIENSKKEYECLLRYLKTKEFCGDVAVVDIGWRGTLQYFLKEIAEKEGIPVKMHGYYISLSEDAKWQLDIKGYVCDNTGDKSCTLWKPFVGLAETLFMSKEGSAKKYIYSVDEKIPSALLYPYEYEKDGTLLPEALQIAEIQEGAISFIQNLRNYPVLAKLYLSPLSAFSKIMAVGNTPTNRDLKMFANFQFMDEKVTYLAKPEKLTAYITAPGKLKLDLVSSRWKVGFLKRLLHLPLNYLKLYKVLSGL